jgi:UDP-GlcNAc:undecaprenyl-phosphate GlcNAc-1-phosphate transferase
MWNYPVVFMISFIITVITTPLVKKIALNTNIVDQPDSSLKIHREPIPYLGGIAIFLGIIPASIFAQFQFDFDKALLFRVEIAIFLIMVLGLLDDILDIKQNYKFIVQILTGLFLVICGLRISSIPFLYLTAPLSIFYVIGACNALNLLDGLDGLACGITAISAFFLSVLFLIKADDFGLVLSVSLLGACLAFLIYNFSPARIFMGDAGSMVLGLMLAILMIRYSSIPYGFVDFVSPILVCGIPIFDTGITYLRRYLNNRPIFPGDRSHFYDRLVDRGFTVKQTVIISYALGVVLGSIAILINYAPLISSVLVILALLVSLFFAVIRMNMLKMQE